VIQLNRLAMRVGRHPECDVVIPTPGTSRQHAEFEFKDGAWYVTDLNSGNGTFVNNTRVRSQQLNAGDEIRIDQTRFTFGGGA
jgi:pSer/pThr/pTyr-binding forkhead associated (FHA) protein